MDLIMTSKLKLLIRFKNILKNTDDVVDVDWMVEADQTEYEFDH